ncbi:helix-turn-helix domain-containing protein [Rhizobium paknamense]|uniref:Transcriptional regulator/transcriptional regulator with XRE-family HTH domain n=1 Tax=Rhizobium paknamense TaxID=1206817 RepID=A0ABU0IDQ4_9HYPH|nr:XRE family transcriptional regulator [Rhizobium paknamense]MDQ0456355.1 putative transcriptional regulator/transcriptional regulator with XRE-family HTH domain [Rhizobium paknamense]
MAIGKLYIGRKVRDLRLANHATQAQFAERLGISVSYLNQIESNQRPVSAAVLLSLADKFKIDLSDLSGGEGDRLLSALAETLADPLFGVHGASVQELKMVVHNAPGIAHALITAHRAYRHNSERLASIGDTLDRAATTVEQTPYEEVRDFFHFMDNYIHDIDVLAEKLAEEIGIGEQEASGALSDYLASRFQVRVRRMAEPNDVIRSFDETGRVLTLSPYLQPATRDFQMALQIAQLAGQEVIDRILRNAGFRSKEAVEVCRIGLHNYFAGALILPYRRFLAAARDLRHDLDLLSARFGASLEQVCHRLSTLQRPGHKGIPIFFARIDRAGNITKRHSAAKLQFARFGAACPLWNAHRAFEAPGQIIRQLAETPDGVRYLCIATQITKGDRGFHAHRQHYALALGCEISYADQFVYADTMDLGSRIAYDPIGISCRICERTDCASRAVPSIKSQLIIDHHRRGPLPYKIRSITETERQV